MIKKGQRADEVKSFYPEISESAGIVFHVPANALQLAAKILHASAASLYLALNTFYLTTNILHVAMGILYLHFDTIHAIIYTFPSLITPSKSFLHLIRAF